MKEKQPSSKFLTVVLVTLACMLLFMLNNGVRSNFGLIATAIQSKTGLLAENTSFAIAIAQCKRQVLFLKKRHLFFLKCGKLFSRVCGILFS